MRRLIVRNDTLFEAPPETTHLSNVTSRVTDKLLHTHSNSSFAVCSFGSFAFALFCEEIMDKLNEVMQATSLWNVLRTASAWIPKATV